MLPRSGAGADVDDLLTKANTAMAGCACGDEFASKRCAEDSRAAVKALAKVSGATIRVAIESDALRLGDFNFKRREFPVKWVGPLGSKSIDAIAEGCERPRLSCGDEDAQEWIEMTFESNEDEEIVVTTAGAKPEATLWRDRSEFPAKARTSGTAA